jgi:hypothetical protein
MATDSYYKCRAKDPSTCPYHSSGRKYLADEHKKAERAYRAAIKNGEDFDAIKKLHLEVTDLKNKIKIAEELNLYTPKELLLKRIEAHQKESLNPSARLEKKLIDLFKKGEKVTYNGEEMQVLFASKPITITGGGEGKTDAYILLQKADGIEEIKISLKQTNADFIENKLSSNRASKVFGENWGQILNEPIAELSQNLSTVDPETKEGYLTLGYRLDITNKPTGNRSVKLPITHSQVVDLYSGKTLPDNLRNSYVHDHVRENSGVATHMLVANDFSSAQEILNNIQPVESYAKNNPDLYLVAKAVNLRQGNKFDSARPLGLFYEWKEGKHSLNHTQPLTITSTQARQLVPAGLLR